MFIKKGTPLTVRHRRKGTFAGVAIRDFDTDREEFYPIAAAQYVEGLENNWVLGDEIPCRNILCTIEVKGEL